MFDRNEPGYLDNVEIKEDLARFESDPYLTKYLVKCFNPEFKIRVTFPKDTPHFSKRGGGIGVRNRIFEKAAEVF